MLRRAAASAAFASAAPSALARAPTAPSTRLLVAAARRASSSATSDDPESRLAALGHALPDVSPPKGSYILCQWADDRTLHLAGHLPKKGDGLVTGKVGRDVTVEDANKAAELAALSLLATIKSEIGSLSRVDQIVKAVGLVNCADGFAQQPAVINGCSDLLGKVFGDKGKHARSAVGTNALPLNVAVEIEMIVRVAAGARGGAKR